VRFSYGLSSCGIISKKDGGTSFFLNVGVYIIAVPDVPVGVRPKFGHHGPEKLKFSIILFVTVLIFKCERASAILIPVNYVFILSHSLKMASSKSKHVTTCS